MKISPFCLIFIVLCSVLCSACSRVPDNVLGKKEMKALLLDIHKSEAMMEINYQDYNRDIQKKEIQAAVFRKHGVTEQQFDTSLVWYGKNLDVYLELYKEVIADLRKEDETLKKRLEEANAQTLSREGDTVDVWKMQRSRVFDPRLLNNVLAFDIVSDENFRKGDRFELRLRTFMSPRRTGERPQIYLAATMTDREVIYNTAEIEHDGWISLFLQPELARPIRNVYGYIAMPSEIGWERMYVDSISLIRMHHTGQMDSVAGQRSMPFKTGKIATIRK